MLPLCLSYRPATGLRRLWKRKPCLTLTVLPPLFPDPSAPRGRETLRLREEARQAMAECLAPRSGKGD